MTENKTPPPAEEQPQPGMGQPRQLSDAEKAYMLAAQAMGNLGAQGVAAARAIADPGVLQQMQSLAGQNMVREIEVQALVQLLTMKGLITRDEFCQVFANISAQIFKVAKEQASRPQILLAERAIPPRGAR